MPKHDDLTVDEILLIYEAANAREESGREEGLRERKKRRLRQRISNVATALFLTEGFDEVSVARIAAASEVSEQTVFNYFPTKESLLFDRSGTTAAAIADAIRVRTEVPLSRVVVDALSAAMPREPWAGVEEATAFALLRRFSEVAESSPTLRAAPYLELEPFMATVGEALAQRVGASRSDPAVSLAAMLIAGLVFVRRRATLTRVATVTSLSALGPAVEADTQRAVDLAAPSLDGFDDFVASEPPGSR
ncbi:MAG TPA: helix-turn-helix domain-containing protein [Candidatus Limnocylindrales bacterium]|jgi:AcrR family transcriptional regulator